MAYNELQSGLLALILADGIDWNHYRRTVAAPNHVNDSQAATRLRETRQRLANVTAVLDQGRISAPNCVWTWKGPINWHQCFTDLGEDGSQFLVAVCGRDVIVMCQSGGVFDIITETDVTESQRGYAFTFDYFSDVLDFVSGIVLEFG